MSTVSFQPWLCFDLPLQLDALCPAVDELRRLSAAPPAGHMAVLQAAAQVLRHWFAKRSLLPA